MNQFPRVYDSFCFNLSTGLAAPAIAAGLGALAPTLGTLIPVIGASGFAAAASAAGTVAGSVAVAASFGGILLPKCVSVLEFSHAMLIYFPFPFFLSFIHCLRILLGCLSHY